MVNYREILRLKSLKYSQREIALSVHSSRNTVKEVVDLATALKIEWPLDPDVTNQELESVLYPGRKGQNTDRMPIDFPVSIGNLPKKELLSASSGPSIAQRLMQQAGTPT